MKTSRIMLAVLALSASAIIVNAQDGGPPDAERPPGQAGPGNGPGRMNGHRPPPSPLMEALDTNHDGIIDSNEIANAPAALKTLDKNGDGKLTPDELRPQRPPRRGGQDGPPGPDGQRPPGPPDGYQHPPGDNQRPPNDN